MTERRGFPIGLSVAAAVSLAILIGLGTWQLERLSWKQGVLARIAALEAAAPLSSGAALERMATGADLDFTRISVRCAGLASAPYVELFSVREGKAGSRLISACRVADGRYRSLLVDRGFVVDEVSARPPVDVSDQRPVEVVGVLRKPEPGNLFTPPNDPAGNRWYVRDVPGMAAALKADTPAPLVLMAETPSNPNWTALVPAPLPADIPNRHLEYALTWYGLAAALAGVYAAILWRGRGAQRSGPGASPHSNTEPSPEDRGAKRKS